MSNVNRQSPGTPSGGQFVAGHRAETTGLALPVTGDFDCCRTQAYQTPAENALDDLIEQHFDGDATQALLALSHRAGIAVAYQDRQVFESHLDRDLADEEWERLKPELEDYDEWLDNSGAAESICEWRSQVLEKAVIRTDDDESDEASPPGPVIHASINDRNFEIPEIWVIGYCQGARLRGEPSGIEDAIAHWAWQQTLAEREQDAAGEQ